MSNTVMMKSDKKSQTIQMNRDALPELNSKACFTLAMSEGKQ